MCALRVVEAGCRKSLHESGSLMVSVVATALEVSVQACEGAYLTQHPPFEERSLLAFYSSEVPPVSIREYVDRLARYACCSPSCMIVALIFVRRACERYRDRCDEASMPRVSGAENELLSSHTVHRLLISAIILAAKMNDDVFYQNSFYAEIGGISVMEMNTLELEMLSLLNFRLLVDADEYTLFESALVGGVVHAADQSDSLLELRSELLNASYLTVAMPDVACPKPSAAAESHTLAPQ
ncbi:Cyclin-P3-1 [Porphyridium purpureum]|uniref:Cyclin-P3-1 n=1 Tax=Porphyridium purpureum TaxID=35688 RepID=A0A5J4Z0Y7_PORPP|nr:Cyclin-P3-1 [Porphyridium purpureum]|eukprot:POR7494..scf208_2